MKKILLDNGIVVDSRGDRLRFGFGLYHGMEDIEALIGKLTQIDIDHHRRLNAH